MKKIITTIVLAAMLLATFVVTASAETYLVNDPCQVNFEIKKADPAYVVKDGIISEGEYEKVTFNKDDLAINFLGSGCWMTADAMADTAEFYFSWDEVHGLNFAVRYDAYPLAAGEALGYPADQIINGCKTSVDQPVINEEGKTKDNFLYNMGVNFSSGWNDATNNHLFYYSIARKTDYSSYLTGHWGQLGPDGVYQAVGGQDFEITYNGTVVTAEWSIPFAAFGYEGVGAGDQIAFTIVATAGGAEVDDPTNAGSLGDQKNSWGVSLGQIGFMVQQSRTHERAKATLVADTIAAPANTTFVDTTEVPGSDPVTTPNPGVDPVESSENDNTTPDPTQPATTQIVTDIVTSYFDVTDDGGNVVTDEDGNKVTGVASDVVTSIVTDAPTESAGGGTSAVPTGSPMIIAAVVAAISACGVVVAKKRK